MEGSTQNTGWAKVGLFFAAMGWLVALIGLSLMTESCQDYGTQPNSASNCAQVYEFEWWHLAFQMLCIVGRAR
jgi:xanthine/uracil permease